MSPSRTMGRANAALPIPPRSRAQASFPILRAIRCSGIESATRRLAQHLSSLRPTQQGRAPEPLAGMGSAVKRIWPLATTLTNILSNVAIRTMFRWHIKQWMHKTSSIVGPASHYSVAQDFARSNGHRRQPVRRPLNMLPHELRPHSLLPELLFL